MSSTHGSQAAAAAADALLVLDALPRAIVVEDLEGTILAWNRVSEAVYGWTAQEVIGRKARDLLVPPRELAAYEDIIRRTADDEPWSGRFTALRRDGGEVELQVWVSPLRDRNGTIVGVVGASDEVSHLRELEQRAEHLAEHLVLALAAGQLGTWRWEIESGITTWDTTMERLFGLESGTFDGTFEGWASRLHPDDAARVLATVEKAVADCEPYEIEHRVVWPDGSIHWIEGRGAVLVDQRGVATGTIGCSVDVTDRKLAEREIELRAAEAERMAALERLQRERLEFLNVLNEATLAAKDHRELMRAITRAAVPRLGDWCTIHFMPSPGAMPEIQVAHSDPARVEWVQALLSRFPYNPDAPMGVASVIRTGSPELLHFDEETAAAAATAAVLPTDEARSILDELSLTSVVSVPLLTNRGVVGAMQFVSAESGRRYDHEDVALAQAVAGRMSAALDNAWLVAQQREIATTLQRALLPAKLPEVEGLTVAVRYWAAGHVNEVGGDFYDLFPIGPGRWAVVIGDVCGTGPEAAAITAKARHTIRAAATHGVEPVEVLEWVNQAILASFRDLFCTAVYGTLESLGDGRWHFRCVAGGHPAPVVVGADGWARTVGGPGTLIGVLPQVKFQPGECELGPGDTLVLNTDGITDVAPPYGLTEEQRVELIRTAARAEGTAEEVARGVQTAIEDVLPISQRDDDIALVAIRIDPQDE